MVSYRALDGTNTKTRRLAYLTAILLILKHDGLSEHQLLTRIVEWNERHKDALRNYWVQTGEVTTTRRNSAAGRYIDLAMAMGVISPIAGLYRSTRMGLVLSSLIEEVKQESPSGPFFLSHPEKIFFLYRLFSVDSDILLTVVDYLIENRGASLAQIQSDFKDAFTSRLSKKIAASRNDSALQQMLLDRRQEVANWKKAERYSEHIVPPRLNWLLDLGFLEEGLFTKHHYFFSKDMLVRLSAIPLMSGGPLHDVSTGWLSSDFWLAAPMLATVGACLHWNNLTPSEQEETITPLLMSAFKAFQPTSVPKISLTQAVLYICIKLIVESQIITSPSQLIEWLSQVGPINNRRYQVRVSARENESYLIVTR